MEAAAWRLLGCAFQATSLQSARAISSQYFTCRGEREKGEKKPHAALRQGRRQTGPPSSGCAHQGSNARDVFLCSPLGGSLWIRKPVPQTADTCSSSSSSAPAKPCGWKGARRGSESLGLCHCGLLPGLLVAGGGVCPGAGVSVGRATMRDR